LVYRGDDRTDTVQMKNRIQELRRDRDWSQADLAALLKVSRQTVNALERGRYDPSLPLAFSIARLFSLSIEEIFQPDGGKTRDKDLRGQFGNCRH